MSDTLCDLVRKAEQLSAQVNISSCDNRGKNRRDGNDANTPMTQLPRVERNLKQLLDIGHQLWIRTACRDSNAEYVGSAAQNSSRASMLLGAQALDGITPPQLRAVQAMPDTDTDMARFVRLEREKAILSALEESHKCTEQAVYAHSQKYIQNMWANTKQDILERLSTTVSTESTSRSVTPMLMEPRYISVSTTADNALYLSAVRQYFQQGTSTSTAPATNILAHIITNLATNQAHTSTLYRVWSLVRDLLLRTHRYVPARACQLLETDHTRRLRDHAVCVPSRQSHGEHVTLCQLAQNYAQSLLSARSSLGDTQRPADSATGDVLWCVVYTLLRAGDMRATLDYIASCEGGTGTHARALAEVCSVLQRRLVDGAQEAEEGGVATDRGALPNLTALQVLYAHSSCVYERYVYFSLGILAADTFPLSEFLHCPEDWLWLQLSHALHSSRVDEQLRFVQSNVLKFVDDVNLQPAAGSSAGTREGSNTLVRLRLLLLTGQFDQALLDVSNQGGQWYSHMVHLALALTSIDLSRDSVPLEQAPSIAAHSCVSDVGVPIRLVIGYLRHVTSREHTEQGNVDKSDIVLYLSLLFRAATGAQASVDVHQLLCRSAVDILMCSDADETFVSLCAADTAGTLFDSATHSAVITCLAERYETNGALERCVTLYTRAGHLERAVTLACDLLCPVVAHPAANSRQRECAVQLATTLKSRDSAVSREQCGRHVTCLYVLLDLAVFFDLCASSQRDTALEVIRRLRLVSLSADTIDVCVAAFAHLDDHIRLCVPDVLLATMRLLRSGSVAKQQARALITYAGAIPLHLPGDVQARLTQIESTIN